MSPLPEADSSARDASTSSDAAAPDRVYSSRELLAEHMEIGIRHEGILYRLRRTASGKLILTK